MGDRTRRANMRKCEVWDTDSLKSEGKRKKQAMQRRPLTTCQKRTDTQPASEQGPPWKSKTLTPSSSTHFYCWTWHYMVWNIPSSSLGQLSQLCALSTSCPPPVYSLWRNGGAEWGKDTHWCVINTVSATDPKHSTMWAAMNKVNSIPTRPSTYSSNLYIIFLEMFACKSNYRVHICVRISHKCIDNQLLWQGIFLATSSRTKILQKFTNMICLKEKHHFLDLFCSEIGWSGWFFYVLL